MPPDPDEIHQAADKLCKLLASSEGGEWGQLGRWIRRLSVGSDLVNVPCQKRPAHRPRDPRVGDRNAQVVKAYRQVRASLDSKEEEIHRHLATRFCISVSYVRQILRMARKAGAL
jgi:hypothetical protein